MQETDESAGVADGLLEPDDWCMGPVASVCREGGVLGVTKGFVSGSDREDKEERVGRTGEERQEGRLGKGVDIVI